jgi:3-deoxy-manno-octulosonate cytidylyltransferase (CMP-KDO synthetase)
MGKHAMPFVIIIPVRFQSTRLPGKALCMIGGKTMIEHVYGRCLQSNADRIVIATDSDRIAECASGFCSDIIMTDAACQSGSERVAQAVHKIGIDSDTIVVNVQGDEPLISADNINQVAKLLMDSPESSVASLYQKIDTSADLINPNIVKVITDIKDKALCFSRAEIPYSRDRTEVDDWVRKQYYKKHIGLYSYRARFLLDIHRYAMTYHEQVERLEQMTWLANGVSMQMGKADQKVAMDVNTQDDLEKICQIWDELAAV